MLDLSTVTLLLLVIILLAWSAVASYFSIKFALKLLKITDAIEESLDILDIRYASISKILEIPIFYDSPQIRQVLSDVRESREAILYVANLVGRIEDGQEKEESLEGDNGDLS